MPTSNPTLCGSIAVRPSPFGVAMHNAGYRALALPFVYVAFGTTDTRGAVQAMRSLGMRGLGVSMPHKIEIMQVLDEIDATAAAIGAVNTVVNDDGHLTGFNTDWTGAVLAIREQADLKGKRAVVVGAGGAARAIVYGLAREGCRVTILNRTAERGQELAQEFGASFGGDLNALAALDGYDILVNATSVGFHAPAESPVPPAALRAGSVVLDAVMLPLETRLIRDAKAQGCIAIPGVRMSVHQATRQFELYTGEPAPYQAMEQALLDAIAAL